jgi:hypothetical protein
MPPEFDEQIIPTDRESLPILQRVNNLLEDYKVFNLTPVAFLTESGEIPIDQQDQYPQKPGYIMVKAIRNDGPEPQTVILTEPRSFEPNMVLRLGRSVLIRKTLLESTAEGAQEVLQHFRFRKVIDTRQVNHPEKGVCVGSIMEESIDTSMAGGVHLVISGVFTKDDMRHMAQLFKLVNKVGHQFTKGGDFYHFRISVPFKDKQNNKWWIDINNKDRMRVYEEQFGQEFMGRLAELVASDETAALYDQEEMYLRECVLGNIIPAILGKDSDGKIVVQILERTAYTEYRAFDYATFLTTLISDPDRIEEFMRFSMEQNPDPGFFRHLRRSVLLDRLGNLVDLVKDPANSQAVDQLKKLALDALNQTGVFDPARYNLVKEFV